MNSNLNGTIIAIDFDGTCVTHEYPKVGREIGAIPVLHKFAEAGCKLILNTMRSGDELKDAIKWFSDNNIPLYAANKNPSQYTWTTSPKVYAHIYLDDAAFNAPLVEGLTGERPYIDWDFIDNYFFGKSEN